MELLIAALSVRPDPNGLPGSNVGEQVVNGLLFWGLLACRGAMIVGGAMWWAGGHSHNAYAAVAREGDRALLCGAAPALINFAEDLGSKVQSNGGVITDLPGVIASFV